MGRYGTTTLPGTPAHADIKMLSQIAIALLIHFQSAALHSFLLKKGEKEGDKGEGMSGRKRENKLVKPYKS